MPTIFARETSRARTRVIEFGFDRMFRYHIPRPFLFVLSLMLAAAVAACDTGISEPQDVIFPESNVSYSRHVQPLFDVSCSFSGCHNSIDRAGNLSLASYFDLLNRAGMIIPGDSARSLLVQVTSGRQPHSVNLSRIITAAHARGVAVWVEEGALNN